jgi:hypothetical protein
MSWDFVDREFWRGTRLAWVKLCLSDTNLRLPAVLVDEICLYILDRLAMLVEFLDAVRNCDLMTLHWFRKNFKQTITSTPSSTIIIYTTNKSINTNQIDFINDIVEPGACGQCQETKNEKQMISIPCGILEYVVAANYSCDVERLCVFFDDWCTFKLDLRRYACSIEDNSMTNQLCMELNITPNFKKIYLHQNYSYTNLLAKHDKPKNFKCIEDDNDFIPSSKISSCCDMISNRVCELVRRLRPTSSNLKRFTMIDTLDKMNAFRIETKSESYFSYKYYVSVVTVLYHFGFRIRTGDSFVIDLNLLTLGHYFFVKE